MKRKLLFILLLISHSIYTQVTDTVPDIVNECLGKHVDSLEVKFENDSIYISGILEANCVGSWSLIRHINQDTIVLIALDDCLANCTCPLYFSTAFPDNANVEYKLIIGYTCSYSSYIDYYFDTTINRNNLRIQPVYNKNEQIKVYPNPLNDFLNIEVLNINEKIERILIYDLIKNQILVEKMIESENKYKINLMEYKSGIYLIEIRSEKNKYYKKIIKL